ncbi:MAG TPA: IPT/TIG domain-containing protein [Solirubrobacteraceae bacterium]|nr:IPT/TIG domain-containing protein [Solirubrobacteraceae bacterium]
MANRTRISTFLRRAAMTAALGALLAPAAAGAATADASKAKKKRTKTPVITAVKPMNVAIGETLEIRGRNFLRGRNKNSVVFKRDGGKAVFVKADVGTTKLLRVMIPAKLQSQFALSAGVPRATRFRLRVLAKKFGRSFSRTRLSPVVSGPRAAAPPGFVQSQPGGDCDGDGTKNATDADDDNDGLTDAVEESLNLNPCVGDTDGDGLADRFEFDCDRDGLLNRDETDSDDDLLSDTVENAIGTDFCNGDSDGDAVEDGYEFQSARDLNDDEYQEANQNLPYPGKRPYPNPLFPDDKVDYDGDSLALAEEQGLWKYTIAQGAARTLSPLTYSDGTQYSDFTRGSDGRRRPALAADGYAKHADFLAWAARTPNSESGDGGYDQVFIANPPNGGGPLFDIRDANLDGSVSNGANGSYVYGERLNYDFDSNGWLSDDERDEDADGLSNYDESHGRLLREYWTGCYSLELPYYVAYAGTSLSDADSDGDGVRDGADDQDHDDFPNIQELSRNAASGWVDWDPSAGQCTPKDNLPQPPAKHHDTDYGRVNPFNPCLPSTSARTCVRHPFAGAGAPFDGSPDWYSLN